MRGPRRGSATLLASLCFAAASGAWRPGSVLAHGLAVLGVLATLTWLATHGMYRAAARVDASSKTAPVYEAAAVGAVVMAIVSNGAGASGTGLVVGGVCVGLALRLGRQLWDRRLQALRARGQHLRNAVVIGRGNDVIDLRDRFADHPDLGYQVSATLAPDSGRASLHDSRNA